MKFTTLVTSIRSIPSDLANSTVKQLRTYASLFRVSASVRTKDALITEIEFHLSDFKACFSETSQAPTPTPVEPPTLVEEAFSDSCTDAPGTFIDTAQFHIIDPLSAEHTRILSNHGLFPTTHKDSGSEIFCYLNNTPIAGAISHVHSVSALLHSLDIKFSRTVDKTVDIQMTEEDFKSGKFFPDFKWNKRDRQWEHTDTNGILTRIYDKTAELIRRGTDSPKWLKGKLDNHDRGVSYALHTVRFEARHIALPTLTAIQLLVPQGTLEHKTLQTYVSAAAEAVSLISLAIKSSTKRKLDELVRTLFSSLKSHFLCGSDSSFRFSNFKAALKKIHPELAPEISKIRFKN